MILSWIDSEDSELCDVLEANSEERVFQEMLLKLDSTSFDEKPHNNYSV